MLTSLHSTPLVSVYVQWVFCIPTLVSFQVASLPHSLGRFHDGLHASPQSVIFVFLLADRDSMRTVFACMLFNTDLLTT